MESWDKVRQRADWLKRAARYDDGSRQADQKCEDLVARRVLAGLGCTEKGLRDLEWRLDIPYDGTNPLMDRTRSVLDVVSGGMFVPESPNYRMGLFVRNGDKRHGVVLDRMPELVESAATTPDGIIVLARVGDTRTAWGYAIMPDGFLPPWILQPPSVILAKDSGYVVWYREVTDLVHDMAEYLRWDVHRT